MSQKRGARIKWYPGHGWLIFVDTPQPVGFVRYICDQMLQVQKQRLLGLKPGDIKDECRRSIALLERHEARQVLSKDKDGGFVYFEATTRVQPTAYFFGSVDKEK